MDLVEFPEISWFFFSVWTHWRNLLSLFPLLILSYNWLTKDREPDLTMGAQAVTFLNFHNRMRKEQSRQADPVLTAHAASLGFLLLRKPECISGWMSHEFLDLVPWHFIQTAQNCSNLIAVAWERRAGTILAMISGSMVEEFFKSLTSWSWSTIPTLLRVHCLALGSGSNAQFSSLSKVWNHFYGGFDSKMRYLQSS